MIGMPLAAPGRRDPADIAPTANSQQAIDRHVEIARPWFERVAVLPTQLDDIGPAPAKSGDGIVRFPPALEGKAFGRPGQTIRMRSPTVSQKSNCRRSPPCRQMRDQATGAKRFIILMGRDYKPTIPWYQRLGSPNDLGSSLFASRYQGSPRP